MARIEFRAQYYGDDAGRRADVAVEVSLLAPLAPSSSTGDPVAVRVHATALSASDLARLDGTGWTDAVVTEAGRTVAGKVSQLEVQDGGKLEFLLTPGD